MTSSDLAARIAAFPRWHYAFDLAGHSTATPGVTRVARHAKRLPYLLDPLITACGGSLAGRRVLDLGCNAGYWALHALRHGAAYVLGVDARAMHIEQASLVFEVEGINRDRYRFVRADVLRADWAAWGRFDIVFCLGLLYHVNRPFDLLERIASSGARFVLIDTVLSKLSGAAFEMRSETTDDPRNAIGSSMVLLPTREAIISLATAHGFDARILEPVFGDWNECDDYRQGDRRGFLLSRRTSTDQRDV
jgi:SAM-dependent methyltransferase